MSFSLFFQPDRSNEVLQSLACIEALQKFADDKGIILAVQLDYLDNVKPSQFIHGSMVQNPLEGDWVDGNNNNLPYDEGIQAVVDRKNIIIAIRPINPMALQLIKEGYDTKQLVLKAKSSSEGITAGFIMEEPLFGKGGKKDKDAQAERIKKSIASGCGRVPLNISAERITMLADKGFIVIKEEREEAGIKIKQVESIYEGVPYCFELKQNKEEPNYWEVWRDNRPVMAFTNPGQTGIKAAVTADYDLFAIYLPKNQAVAERPMTVYPMVKEGASTMVKKIWQRCVDSNRQPNHINLDPDKGNLSIPEGLIIKQLNEAIKQAGYQGKSLVWHGAETANPDSPGPDFPIRVYFPGKAEPQMINNVKELAEFYKNLQTSSYQMEENARFSFRTG